MARTPRPVARSWQPDPALLDGLTIAAVALDADGTVIYANPTALDLFGSPFDKLIDSDARTRFFDEPERGAVDQVLKLVRRTGSWTGELTMLASGTSPVAMRTSWTPLTEQADGGALVLIEGTDEATDPYAPGQPLGSRLRRLAEVTSELLVAADVDAVSAIVTDHMMKAAGATAASLSLMVDDETLALMALRGGLEETASRWATYPVASNVPTAESIRTGRPVLVRRDDVDERYPALGGFADGTGSILCLPLVAGGRVLGAVSLSFPGRRALSEAENLFLQLLADTCAMTLDRVAAQRAARDREAKLTFLAAASAKLSSDLDYEATLTAVAEAAVPWFADWCAISLAEDGLLRTIAVAHTHPERIALVRELQERYPADPSTDQGGYRVLRTGVSLLVPEVTDELLVASSRDEEHLELMRALNLSSGLSCALKVGDRTFGVISWVAGEGGRRFSEDDLTFGEDLAQRAAIAIDNAQLHSQMRTAALELQRAVLPDELPRVEGWSTSVQYHPAGRTEAGGDFYDVVPLEDGRLAMFVGDVMGRGVAAASVMAQMRVGDPHPRRRRPGPRSRPRRHGPGLRRAPPRTARHDGVRRRGPGARPAAGDQRRPPTTGADRCGRPDRAARAPQHADPRRGRRQPRGAVRRVPSRRQAAPLHRRAGRAPRGGRRHRHGQADHRPGDRPHRRTRTPGSPRSSTSCATPPATTTSPPCSSPATRSPP